MSNRRLSNCILLGKRRNILLEQDQSANEKKESDAKKLNLSNNTVSSPPIIKIVPNILKPSNLSKKSTTSTVAVQGSNNKQQENDSSTKTKEVSDDEYASKTNSSNCEINKKQRKSTKKLVKDTSEFLQFKNLHRHNTSILKELTDKHFMSSKVTHSHRCCSCCRETLKLILQQQKEILSYLKKDYTVVSMEKKLDLLPSMPFKELDHFLDFDESLTHESIQLQFLCKLKKLLVSSEQKSVSNVMTSIITDELCKKISWVGIKHSHAFGTTNMVKLIIDLLQEHHKIGIDVIKSRLAEWLRRCGDRINCKLRKEKKKEEQN